MEENIVYSTPKEEREKKDNNKKRNFEKRDNNKRPFENREKNRDKENDNEKDENTTQYDSDGFEIITEKVKNKKPKKRDFDGEKRRFKKDENKDGEKERPQTTVRKSSNVSDKVTQKPKTVLIEKVEMEVVNIIFFLNLYF
jgi:hypothetical protein